MTLPHPPLLLLHLFFLLLPLVLSSSSSFGDGTTTTEFDFSTLPLAGLKLLGDAHWNNGTLRLTRDLLVPNSGAGRALYSTPVRFRHSTSSALASFSTFFTFSVLNLNPSSIGGGLAFLISPGNEAVGGAGGLLGLGGARVGFIAVEFDTFMDPEFDDINGNHVGVDANSLVSLQAADLGATDMDLKSGRLINSWIDYNGTSRTFTVCVSYSDMKPKQPQLTVALDVAPYVDEFMFVGFSGSTQGSTEVHSIKWWSFKSSLDLPSSPSSESPGSGSAQVPAGAAAKWGGESSPACVSMICKEGVGAVAGVATAGAVGAMVLSGGLMWVIRRRVRERRRRRCDDGLVVKVPRCYRYKELKEGTNNFDAGRMVGSGAFGRVYRGVVGGERVAVKRCREGQGKGELKSELLIIGGMRHRNLVRLQGWCEEKGEILLVYELVERGSLDKALFEWTKALRWEERMKVLKGVAAGLAYMHHECEKQVIHRDVKSSNIMLEEGYEARVGDFGLAMEVEERGRSVGAAAGGTMGYMAPEYVLTGRATEKTDVFSYGAVVMEVVTGRRAVGGGMNLGEWVWKEYSEGRVEGVVDPRMLRDGSGEEEEEIVRVVKVGLACLQGEAVSRPSMRGVAEMLAGEVEVPPLKGLTPSSIGFTTAHLLLTLQSSSPSSFSSSSSSYSLPC